MTINIYKKLFIYFFILNSINSINANNSNLFFEFFEQKISRIKDLTKDINERTKNTLIKYRQFKVMKEYLNVLKSFTKEHLMILSKNEFINIFIPEINKNDWKLSSHDYYEFQRLSEISLFEFISLDNINTNFSTLRIQKNHVLEILKKYTNIEHYDCNLFLLNHITKKLSSSYQALRNYCTAFHEAGHYVIAKKYNLLGSNTENSLFVSGENYIATTVFSKSNPTKEDLEKSIQLSLAGFICQSRMSSEYRLLKIEEFKTNFINIIEKKLGPNSDFQSVIEDLKILRNLNNFSEIPNLENITNNEWEYLYNQYVKTYNELNNYNKIIKTISLMLFYHLKNKVFRAKPNSDDEIFTLEEINRITSGYIENKNFIRSLLKFSKNIFKPPLIKNSLKKVFSFLGVGPRYHRALKINKLASSTNPVLPII